MQSAAIPSHDATRNDPVDAAGVSSLDAYAGPYLIDHLDEAIVRGDDAALRHFFSLLLPRPDTHETIARILCLRDASELLTELLSAGFWPRADLLRELLGISAAAGSCHTMTDLLALATDRGMVFDALASGWVNALAGQAGTGTLIQRINTWFPGSVGVQAVLRALEAAHESTLDAVLECLVVANTVQEAGTRSASQELRPDSDHKGELTHLIGSLVHDCLDDLTAETVTVLLNHGLDPGITDASGRTLVERVFQQRSESMALLHVFHQWIGSLPDGMAMTMYVLTGNDEQFAECCRTARVESLAGFNARAALDAAISRDNVGLVRVLLTMGAQMNETSDAGAPALLVAIEQGATACVDLLLKAKADPNGFAPADGRCCLTLAASTGHQQIVRRLLEAGADATRCDGRGNTALHYAAVRGDLDLCARLLRAGGHLEARNLTNGSTPLSMACRFAHRRDDHDVIGFLLDMGADIETRDAQGKSPIELAAASGRSGLMDALLDCGADPQALKKKRRGALKSIAKRMMSMVEREKSPVDDVHNYDQAA